MTVLVMTETLCRSIWAHAVQMTGANRTWIPVQIVEDMEKVGLIQERIMLKADQEASNTDIRIAIVKARAGHSTAT